MRNLKSILAKVEEFVSPNFCNDLARNSRFIQRSTSQLKGHEFAQALIIPNAFLEAETLNCLAVRMKKINKACNLSAPALAQRINTIEAQKFMKSCFGKVLKAIAAEDFLKVPDLPRFDKFHRILIQDSTIIELHEKLSSHFKGSGGAASRSAVKIDYIFDYRSEQVVDIEFFSSHIPDQRLANRIVPFLQKDDLVVRDLGYFAVREIREIERQGSYYISRLKANVHVYESQEATNPIDFGKFMEQNAFQGILDAQVFISEEKIPVRLIACQLGEQVVNERLRKANRTVQRHGRKLSRKVTSFLKYTIYITNVPSEHLSKESVMASYRARWRIELIFKQWKSCLKLHTFKGYNKERIYCLLYGRLIMVLVVGLLSALLMIYARTMDRELSCFKLIKYLIWDHALPRAIQEGTLDQFIGQLLQDLPRRMCMDKRRRCSLRSNVRMANEYCLVENRGDTTHSA